MDINRFYRPFFRYFRTKRMYEFARYFGVEDKLQIIDVGGTAFNWDLISQKPRVTIVNIGVEERQEGNLFFKRGDGKKLDFGTNSFDLAYSNSVIEHVGDSVQQRIFAREIMRVAPKYYVQTPNKWFPIEPHLLTVFIHFLPARFFRPLAPFLSLRRWLTGNRAEAEDIAREVRLLTYAEMRELFPDCEICREHFLGMTKSLIAVKR